MSIFSKFFKKTPTEEVCKTPDLPRTFDEEIARLHLIWGPAVFELKVEAYELLKTSGLWEGTNLKLVNRTYQEGEE